jgi:hypothetical protein
MPNLALIETKRITVWVAATCTVLIARHILLRKVSLSTRAWTQKSCTVSQLVCAFPNPV